jgi:GH15 family glucan-1,4-alpha-glucosidase
MHKYKPDKSLGSSWHPWVGNGKKQFPIQEDETALVLYALWQHYILSKDLEFIESIYNCLIKKSAEFMVKYRDDKTGLPLPSYDLWEMYYSVHTFTSSAVYGALIAASKFAGLLGKVKSERKYKNAAEEIKKAILKHLYDGKREVFYKNISIDGKKVKVDETIDISSVYGIFKFGVLPETDIKLKKAFENTINRLELKTKAGGIARFEGDIYHRHVADIPGNPWIVTTMWVAQYYIALAKNESDMEPVKKWISWAVKHASFSGVLPEQVDPFTGEHISAAPLTWSHAEFVTTIITYLEKLESLGICEACYPIT